MIQGINDLFITGSAHAETPPHPGSLRRCFASSWRSDLSPQAGRGEPAQTSRAAGQRAVDHGNRVRQAIHRDERPEAWAFFLAEQHLIEHVEPVERNAR